MIIAKSLTLSRAKRALKRGNGVLIAGVGTTASSTGILFRSFAELKAYVKANGFHGDCYIVPKSKLQRDIFDEPWITDATKALDQF